MGEKSMKERCGSCQKGVGDMGKRSVPKLANVVSCQNWSLNIPAFSDEAVDTRGFVHMDVLFQSE